MPQGCCSQDLGQARNSSGQHCSQAGQGVGAVGMGSVNVPGALLVVAGVSSGFGVQVTVTALALLCQGRAFTRVLCTPSCDLVPALLPCQALGPQVRSLAGAVLPTRSGTCRACQGHQARLLGFVPWGRGGCAGTASLVRRGHSLTWLDSVLLGLCACPASPERGEESAERAPQHHHPQAGLSWTH